MARREEEYAILTAEIAKAAFGVTPGEHKKLKGLILENLRDHMTDLELIFSMLGEAATTEITRVDDAKGFQENKRAAHKGGEVAGKARKDRMSLRSEFYEFIAGSILVAHNASFDVGFLRNEFALLSMSLNNQSLCTLKMSRNLYPHLPNHKLETVSRYLLGESANQMQRHRQIKQIKDRIEEIKAKL